MSKRPKKQITSKDRNDNNHIKANSLLKRIQDSPIYVSITIITTIIAAIVFITGRQSLRDFFSRPTLYTPTIESYQLTSTPRVTRNNTPTLETFTKLDISTPPQFVGAIGGETKTNPIDQALIVYIPDGEFSMGLTLEEIRDLQLKSKDCSQSLDSSTPNHTVYLDAYWIYKSEVSNRMYKQCVEAGFCKEPVNVYTGDPGAEQIADYYTNSKYDNYPAVWVTWADAENYCRWAGGKLPTEAEWEKAARGTDGRIFPWGNDFPTNQNSNVFPTSFLPSPIDDFPLGASPYGVLNMAGNVYEWVADWYSSKYYQTSPYENPTGPANLSKELDKRVVRGGAFAYDLGCATTATHDWWEEFQAGYVVGFRCAVPNVPAP